MLLYCSMSENSFGFLFLHRFSNTTFFQLTNTVEQFPFQEHKSYSFLFKVFSHILWSTKFYYCMQIAHDWILLWLTRVLFVVSLTVTSTLISTCFLFPHFATKTFDVFFFSCLICVVPISFSLIWWISAQIRRFVTVSAVLYYFLFSTVSRPNILLRTLPAGPLGHPSCLFVTTDDK